MIRSKVRVETFVKCYACNGSGLGTRVTRGCNLCKRTGRASRAFRTLCKRYGFEELSGKVIEDDFGHILRAYIIARYGDAKKYLDEEKDISQLIPVLDHSIDRKALWVVCESATHEGVFDWLAAEQDRVMADYKEDVG